MRLHACAMCFVGASLLLMRPAVAGRPMTTDDAAITPLDECSAQTWLQADRQASETWFLPACTFLPNLEVTVGGALHRGDRDYPIASAQLKWLLHPEAPGEWGWAASLGWSRSDASDSVERGDARPLVLLASYQARDESWMLHVNVGTRDVSSGAARTSWGVAYEYAPAARMGAFAEMFGVRGDAPTVQTGLRYDLVPQRLSLNLTIGAHLRDGLHEPFVTIGLNL